MSEHESLLAELRDHTAAVKQMTQAIMILAEVMADQMIGDEQAENESPLTGMGLAAGKVYRMSDDPL